MQRIHSKKETHIGIGYDELVCISETDINTDTKNTAEEYLRRGKMKIQLQGPIRIRGRADEIKAKKSFTLILAGAYLLSLSLTDLRITCPMLYYAFLLTGFEIAVIETLGRTLKPFWKGIPLLQYTGFCTIHLLMTVAAKTSPRTAMEGDMLCPLITVCLLWMAAFSMYIPIQNEDDLKRCRCFVCASLMLLLVFIMDIGTSTVLLIRFPYEQEIIDQFFTRMLFYVAVTLLATPDCVSLNTRRMLRLVVMFGVIWICFIVATGLFAARIKEQIHTRTLLFLASLCAFDILTIGSIVRFVVTSMRKRRWIKPYQYKDVEDADGKRNSDTDRNEIILDLSLTRDYYEEYLTRMWNVSFYASDIANIQTRLNYLRGQFSALRGETSPLLFVQQQQIREEMEDLLGKLSVKYGFSNGFNRFSFDCISAE